MGYLPLHILSLAMRLHWFFPISFFFSKLHHGISALAHSIIGREIALNFFFLRSYIMGYLPLHILSLAREMLSHSSLKYVGFWYWFAAQYRGQGLVQFFFCFFFCTFCHWRVRCFRIVPASMLGFGIGLRLSIGDRVSFRVFFFCTFCHWRVRCSRIVLASMLGFVSFFGCCLVPSSMFGFGIGLGSCR
jgi:hypothetical protein